MPQQRDIGALQRWESTREGQWRLAPLDGVLERLVVLAVAALRLPYIPDLCVPEELATYGLKGSVPEELRGRPVNWRRWVFLFARESFLNPHRSSNETYQVVRRMGFWPSLAADVSQWRLECAVCRRHRGHSAMPPLRGRPACSGLTVARCGY